MQAKENAVFVSIVIPTFNNEKDLSACLQAIKTQKYPKNKVEVLICDGGSTDNTKKIAKRFNCKVIENKKRLAEYGVALGFSHAKGDVVTVLAADNEIKSIDFLSQMTKPFLKNKNIVLTYPLQKASPKDSWIAKYINTFTDPINHFIYGNASNTRTFEKEYSVKTKTSDYIVFNFTIENYPMIALAQGTTVRRDFQRKKNSYGDDIAPIVDIIRNGQDMAYIPRAVVFHHTTQNLSEYIRKQRWAIGNYLTKESYGVGIRQNIFSKKRKIKKLFWPLYACSIILPIYVSVKGLVIDKHVEWLYHPLLTYMRVKE